MKEKIKAGIAFTILSFLILAGFVLTGLDKSTDVYPGDDTKIYLYGEAHGNKEYYDIEFTLWKGYYDQGFRSLFLELPYYNAEFLNLWMKEDTDNSINQLYKEMQGTPSGNKYYLEFFHKIKEKCPDTVFYGTDVGHQFDTTGTRYLRYLKKNGLADSENYKLARECIRQGKEFYAHDTEGNGVSPIRESYMVSNFIDAYTRCGQSKIMGIYGSNHTNLDKSKLMAGRLREHYGDVISSVKLSTLAFGQNKPYQLGLSITGIISLLLLFIPNILWAKIGKPAGYKDLARGENPILVLLERIGQIAVSVSLVIFPATNPHIRKLSGGVFLDAKLIFWLIACGLMFLYECYWIRYFRSKRRLKDLYASFAGFPIAGATLPVLAALLLGIYAENIILISASVILGIGHIGIHMMHRKECNI